MDSLKKQTEKQINKQKNSEKYIPNTFIENSEAKDYMRYFSDSVVFYEKYYNELINLDFNFLNQKLEKKNLPLFDLETSDIPLKICHPTYSLICENLAIKLENKLELIKNIKISSYYKDKFERKLLDKKAELPYFKSQIGLILENAGQGKTNFVCDFAETFLLRKNIPCTFLTGFELDATNLQKSFLQKIFPIGYEKIEIQDFIDAIKLICEQKNTFYTIIIDGLNENTNSKQFSINLESFIESFCDYPFIKFILTCRTEYFSYNFNNINQSSFKHKIVKITRLMDRRIDNNKFRERLFSAYCEHYNVDFDCSMNVYDELTNDFFLLRIFTETYQKQNLGTINHIYKTELFKSYYNSKCKQIDEKISQNNSFKIIGNFSIRPFIENIISYMINNRIFMNIPINEILTDDNHLDIYNHFLDENLLLRKDLNSDSIFGDKEVVNFTFDWIRDYLLSDYLVEKIFKQNSQEFECFLNENFTEKSLLLEGCGTFLFTIAKQNANKPLLDILQRQTWYNDIFLINIFEIKEKYVSEEDLRYIEHLFIQPNEYSKKIVPNLLFGGRCNTQIYRKLNTTFLISMLHIDNDKYYEKLYSSFFFQYSKYGYSTRINIEDFVNQLDKIFTEFDFNSNEYYHNIFEFLIYLFPFFKGTLFLYEKYRYKYPNQANKQLLNALKVSNSILKTEINNFILRYEIKL